MSISLIAAVGKNLELGKNNDLIWHFKEDMKFFKEVTTGHKVIMGRKTFESLPKALPNRENIIISSNKDYAAEGATVVCDIQSAIDLIGDEEAFIIGGGTIYKAFLPFADALYLTEIDAACPDADTYFPVFDKSNYIRTLIKSNDADGVHFDHIKYTKITPSL